MVNDAMQRAVQAWAAAQGNGNGHAAGEALAAEEQESGGEDRFDERGYKWCRIHKVWMKLRRNAKGTWHSHWLENEKDYCKGK